MTSAVTYDEATMVPTTITFNWRACEKRSEGLDILAQPVVHNGKLFIRSESFNSEAVLEYTPGYDQWAELPSPPVKSFTVAMLRGQLLIVGGENKSTQKKTNTILTFNTQSKKWVKTFTMPTALTLPNVMGYQDHLIVAGGENTNKNRTSDVNILDTTSKKWKAVQPLPIISNYYSVLIEDTLYLVGLDKAVLHAHVPTLICSWSQA